MALWSSIKKLIFPPRVQTRADLKAFIESRAAYLAQKPMMELAEAKANRLFSTLITEQGFRDAYERGRWYAYPPAFSMVTEMTEGYLREATGAAAEPLGAALTAMARECFAAMPLPPGAQPSFWEDAGERLERDIAQAAIGAPKAVRNIPHARAEEIFDAVPVAKKLRRDDFEMFRNSLAFHLTELRVELEERADPKAVVQALLASDQ